MKTRSVAALTLLALGSAGCSGKAGRTEQAQSIVIVKGAEVRASGPLFVQQDFVSSPLQAQPAVVTAGTSRPLTLVIDEQGIAVSFEKASDPYHLRDVVLDDVS